MTGEPQVKKIKAYPFPVTLKGAAEVVQGQLVKLTQVGFLAEVPMVGMKTGDNFECEFETPVLHNRILVPCKIVKLYSQWAGGGNPAMTPQQDSNVTAAATVQVAPPAQPVAGQTKSLMLVEVHFTSTTAAIRQAIVAFINATAKAK